MNIISIFNMKVWCVFSLELPCPSCAIFSKRLKNEFKLAVVKVSSVFEQPKVYL